MRVAFFTAGTMGAGHSVRGLAVRRGLERRGFPGEVRLFGPTAASWSPGFEAVPMTEAELRDPKRAKESALARTLADYAPDLLIVDMFWAPLRHVLPLAGCEAWLLLRWFPEKWLIGPPGHPFEAALFARRISIEPSAVAPEITDRIDPIVIANHDEQRPRGALREHVGARADERLVVVMHAGLRGEIDGLAPALGRNDRLVSLDLHANALFPAAEWLRDADAIHAAAGYNTFWEAQWLGHAARTHFTPFVRPNDDQTRRFAASDRPMKANGADTLAEMIIGRASTSA